MKEVNITEALPVPEIVVVLPPGTLEKMELAKTLAVTADVKDVVLGEVFVAPFRPLFVERDLVIDTVLRTEDRDVPNVVMVTVSEALSDARYVVDIVTLSDASVLENDAEAVLEVTDDSNE